MDPKVATELEAILDRLGDQAVRVCEGGGPENLCASIAMSVEKLLRDNESLSEQCIAAWRVEKATADAAMKIRAENEYLRAEVALMEPKVLADRCIGAMGGARNKEERRHLLELLFTSRASA